MSQAAQPTASARHRYAVMAVVAAVLWGVSGNVAQLLFSRHGVGLDWLVLIRMLAAGGVLLGYSFARDPRGSLGIWRRPGDAAGLALFSIVGMLGVQYTYFAAIHASNAATATILQGTGPAMIVVYYVARDRRAPTALELLALALAGTGTFLLVTHGDPRALAITPPALFWGLISAVALAFYTIQPISLLERFPAPLVIGWSMSLGGLALSLRQRPWEVAGSWNLQAGAALAFLIVLGTLVPFTMYLSAVRVLGAKVTSLLACAEPLAAALVAVAWLGVPFLAPDWAGGACIVLTIALLSR